MWKVEKDWITEAGLRAVVIMTQHSTGEDRHRCGYVGVDSKHPLYGVNYDENAECLQRYRKELLNSPIDKRGIMSVFCWNGGEVSPDIYFNVHGGITYSDKSANYPVESDLWWFGFDCAHCDDLSKPPKGLVERYPELYADTSGVFRSLEYCVDECESLAKQLKEVCDYEHTT